jgi:hypothetical protein
MSHATRASDLELFQKEIEMVDKLYEQQIKWSIADEKSKGNTSGNPSYLLMEKINKIKENIAIKYELILEDDSDSDSDNDIPVIAEYDNEK